MNSINTNLICVENLISISHESTSFNYAFLNSIFYISILIVFSQFDNVNNCLNTLHTIAVGGLDEITTNDICSGELRKILDLFYALSVYKQAAKLKSGVSTGKQPTHAPQASTQPIHQPLSQQTQPGLQPATVNASNEMLNR